LKFAFVELPKFKKTEEELETHFDKWLYLLKNLPELKARPVSVQDKHIEKAYWNITMSLALWVVPEMKI